ncbi:HAD family hydrolase [Dyadobacter psychrotolerans]|uniref:HAD family hydrolase n=2 Tax=Dyadobacter psychrotolerans TaxID=2541721 RepID=A0A4R5DBU2_9BACT|nr:HAD family hydrolase [Dyadobacter psychrotolerans]
MIVFDMAGTTVNENNVVYKTLCSAINQAGFNFSLEQVLQVGAGKEKLEAIRSVLRISEIDDEALAGRIFSKFLVLLSDAYENLDVAQQDNATLLFRVLKENGMLIVLNTGYNRITAESLVQKVGWKLGVDYDLLVTASDVSKNRPQPDMILLAMQHFGIEDPLEVIKVGDSTVDIMEGQNAGCKINIGITTGAHTREQLTSANPEFIVDDLLDLLPIVEMQNQQPETV